MCRSGILFVVHQDFVSSVLPGGHYPYVFSGTNRKFFLLCFSAFPLACLITGSSFSLSSFFLCFIIIRI